MAHANLQILINVSPVMKELDPVPTTIHLRMERSGAISPSLIEVYE